MTRARRRLAGVALLGLAGLSEACSATREPEHTPRVADATASPITTTRPPASALASTPAPEPGLAPALDAAASPAPTASAAAGVVEPPASAERAPGPLAAFHAALRGLEKHERSQHVRVLWLGDSHAQADYWSGALRKGLQARFGRGGPGFVHVGFKGYRHDAATLEVKGTWLLRPKGPSTSVPTGDGSFGLGGILFRGSDASSTAAVSVSDPTLKAPLKWDLCYKLATPNDELAVELTDSAKQIVRRAPDEALGALRHLVLRSPTTATLKVTHQRGGPELCGVVVEATPGEAPGVVLDTLGINGARYGTALAWNEAAWASELVRRAPALVILEYGTNELSDRHALPEVHVKRMSALVDRLRRHAPSASCLVLAPTDRADRQAIEPALVEALERGAAAKGCAYWNTVEAMGGPGSIVALKNESPPRAAKDGIHLNPRGYRYLGERLLADLLRELTP